MFNDNPRNTYKDLYRKVPIIQATLAYFVSCFEKAIYFTNNFVYLLCRSQYLLIHKTKQLQD